MPRYSEATLAAIKNAVGIVTLAQDYGLHVTRAGSKFKALCPFHDDHNPSLILDPDRQSYKCWSCGAGGDTLSFVQEYDRVDFAEAARKLAEMAGIALEPSQSEAGSWRGPSKTDLIRVNAWAEAAYVEALAASEPARAYLAGRGILPPSMERFRLGYAPGERGWLSSRAKRAGFSIEVLDAAGLVSRADGAPGTVRERFHGRLMFPIHDVKGRPIAFGGRVLPEVERLLVASGKNVAKYLNSPETAIFHKKRVLYAGDLARSAAREAGWVAVVEGYTDVIVAHQVGLRNVVGTLGTALGDDHVSALRRLSDKVVLVFDGDAAGQNAADRSLELFLKFEVDVRVLTLPEKLDPCDFLLDAGADAFRGLVGDAVDPLTFALRRAGQRHDLHSIEGSRQAAEWVLGVLAKVPPQNKHGLDVKVDKALDTLSSRLHVPAPTLRRRLKELRQDDHKRAISRAARAEAIGETYSEAHGAPPGPGLENAPPAIPRLTDLDPTDRELVHIVLNEPSAVGRVITRVAAASLRDEPLRSILGACYDLHGEGEAADFGRVSLRLESPALKSLAAGLLLPLDPGPLPEGVKPAPWEDRLRRVLAKFAERERHERLRDLRAALDETNESEDPSSYQALKIEYLRLLTQRPDTKRSNAS